MIVHDIDTFNTIKALLCANFQYRLSKITDKYYRDTTQREYENCRKRYFVFKGKDCIYKMFDQVFQNKGEAEKINNNIV